MMKKKILWSAVALWVCGVAWCAAGEPFRPVVGIVKKAPLNVRAGMGLEYTPVAKLALKNPVAITAAGKDWLEIRPTENSCAWVLKRYIRDGKLTANVNLRSGPGVGYESLGIGRGGTPVSEIGEPTAAGWIKIRAFYSLRMYVGRPAIEVDEADLAKLPKLIDRKLPPPDRDLILLEGNFSAPGKAVTMTGYLYTSEDNIKAITHVLYEEKKSELEPAAFVVPTRIKLTALNEKKVRLSGTQYPVAGWELPVIVVHRAVAVP